MQRRNKNDREVHSLRAEPWAAILLACVILAYAGLLRRSHWQGDEYIVFAFERAFGWAFLKHWYLGWSPRLVSDLLYAAYGAAMLVMHRPLAGTCMALLWGGLLLTCLLPALPKRPDRPTRLVAGLAIFALSLTGHDVAEVFYWPAGGLSYLPTLAGAIWLFWCLADGLGGRTWQAALSLILISGSSEVGAFLALTICFCIVAWNGRRYAKGQAWLAPGTALAVLDLALVLHGRVGKEGGPGTDHAVAGHALASLMAALPMFAREIVVPDSEAIDQAGWVWSLAARFLVLVAARWSFSDAAGKSRSLLLPFSGALLLACLASLASAYHEFGALCCQRHDTMRACFITLAYAAIGAWSAGWRKPVFAHHLAALAWPAAVLILFVPRFPWIIEDWQTASQAVTARAQTWASGFGPGDDMIYTNPPRGHIAGTDGIPPGHYDRADKKLAWYGLGILDFFGKKTVTILPPGPP